MVGCVLCGKTWQREEDGINARKQERHYRCEWMDGWTEWFVVKC